MIDACGWKATTTPPAKARSLSPLCRLPHAWCTAINPDEQAVSTVNAGPCSPSAWATRPDASPGLLPANPCGPSAGPWVSPTKTPVCVCASEVGSSPACSTASHDDSSSNRCCGSIATASPSVIPKKPKSKPPTPSRKAPHPPTVWFGSHRSTGISPTRSSPRSNAPQRRSGESIPPGSRQAIPMTATGVTGPARNARSPVRAFGLVSGLSGNLRACPGNLTCGCQLTDSRTASESIRNRLTAAATRSSVAVSATRTCRTPDGP